MFRGLVFVLVVLFWLVDGFSFASDIGRWEVYQIDLTTTNSYENPYLDVNLLGTFVGPSNQRIVIEGFWDGSNNWKIRMAPTEAGHWTYTTTSNDNQLIISGDFDVKPSSNRGFIRVNPKNPYTFMYGDGTPFFWIGDTSWNMFSTMKSSIGYEGARFTEGLNGSDFKSFIDRRSTQGFNVIVAGTAVSENEGGKPFGDPPSYDRTNPTYWQWIDRRVEYMNSVGIIARLQFSRDIFSNATQVQSEKYMRYVIARYSAYNVIWDIVGEFEKLKKELFFLRLPIVKRLRRFIEPLLGERWSAVAFFRNMGNLVKQRDPYKHLTSIHTLDSNNEFGNDSWLDYIMQQRFGTPSYLHRQILNDRIYGKPVLNEEYGYEGNEYEHTADHIRTKAWAIVTAGGFFTYGGSNMPGHPATISCCDHPFDPSRTDLPGAVQVSILKKFMEGTKWWLMDPHDELIQPSRVGFCLASPGEKYLIYLPDGGSVTLNLSQVGGNFIAKWYNPRTGEFSNQTTVVTGGGNRNFVPIFSGDAVLHVKKTG